MKAEVNIAAAKKAAKPAPTAGPPLKTPPEPNATGKGDKQQPGKAAYTRTLKVQKPILAGKDVKALQNALIAKGCSCGISGADGRYGKDTAYAVRCFQAKSGLVVDGKAGMHTIKALGGVWKPNKNPAT